MQRIAICLAEHRHSFNAELLCCVNDPAGNFPTVGNQDFVKQRLLLLRGGIVGHVAQGKKGDTLQAQGNLEGHVTHVGTRKVKLLAEHLEKEVEDERKKRKKNEKEENFPFLLLRSLDLFSL